MAALTSSLSSFDEDVQRASESGVAIVDFWAPWCGPCRMVGPILDRLHDDESVNVTVLKVNADDELELSERYGISSIPTMLFFKNGELVKEIVGARNEVVLRAELASLI